MKRSFKVGLSVALSDAAKVSTLFVLIFLCNGISTVNERESTVLNKEHFNKFVS